MVFGLILIAMGLIAFWVIGFALACLNHIFGFIKFEDPNKFRWSDYLDN